MQKHTRCSFFINHFVELKNLVEMYVEKVLPDKHFECRIGDTGNARGRDSLVLGRRVILPSLTVWLCPLMMADGD